jgi:hypothetical protein
MNTNIIVAIIAATATIIAAVIAALVSHKNKQETKKGKSPPVDSGKNDSKIINLGSAPVSTIIQGNPIYIYGENGTGLSIEKKMMPHFVTEKVNGNIVYFSITNSSQKGNLLIHSIESEVLDRVDLVDFYMGPRKFLKCQFSKVTQTEDVTTILGDEEVCKIPSGDSESFACEMSAEYIHVICRFVTNFTDCLTGSKGRIFSDKYYMVKDNFVRVFSIQEIINEAIAFQIDHSSQRYQSILLISTLGKSGELLAVEPLLQILAKLRDQGIKERKENKSLIETVVRALGLLKDPRAVDPLLKMLSQEMPHCINEQDEIGSFVATIVDALGLLKDQRALEPIANVLKIFRDPKYRHTIIHWSSAKALGNFQDKSTVPLLIECLDENDSSLFQSYLNEALQNASGRNFGDINWYTSDTEKMVEETKQVIHSWRAWFSQY